MGDDNLMDLDLNQEPLDAPVNSVARFGHFLDELDTPYFSIEERMRQLEAVTNRSVYRRRWRQARNSMAIRLDSGNQMVNVVGDIGVGDVLDRTAERERGCKRDSSHLVAKALEIDSEVKMVESDSSSYFDCNICLDTAREPILTCCGHLFCWPCFYQVPYVDSTCKECPVCKGEVSDSAVIPIYGNGRNHSMLEFESESGLKIPPRPKAKRVESIRQQHMTRNEYEFLVAEAIRRIRISIGATGDQRRELGGIGNSGLQSDTSELQNAGTGVSQLQRPQWNALVLPERALSNVERLFENFENTNQLLPNTNQLLPMDARSPLVRNSAFLQSDGQPPDSREEINTVLPTPSSSQTNDVSGRAARTTSMRTDNGINLPVSYSSSSFLRRTRRRLG